MNFNNINGVWPQIKDYIDSKLGGGVSDKYKHMIYIPNLQFIEMPSLNYNYLEYGDYYIDKVRYYWSGSDVSGEYQYNVVYKDNGRLYFYIKNGTIGFNVPFFDIIKLNNGYAFALKEGWYINCCGLIYDYQGNIVE